MDEFIRIGNLPHALNDAIVQKLARYSVAFLRVENTTRGQEVDLLGSGTLVAVGNARAILTAHHVVQVLPRSGRLGILLERTREPHTIDTQGLAFLEIARGTQDSLGPDLGAVVLAPPIASAIEAKKAFYNLDSCRNLLLHRPPDLRDGVWFVQGFLDEGTIVTQAPDGRAVTKAFYNFSGVGGPETGGQVGDYDYFEFPVSHTGRPVAPRSWGGMSGAGLWQVPLKRDRRELVYRTPLLSGVVFYQQLTTETVCGVKCHGRRSVYHAAYNSIQGKS